MKPDCPNAALTCILGIILGILAGIAGATFFIKPCPDKPQAVEPSPSAVTWATKPETPKLASEEKIASVLTRPCDCGATLWWGTQTADRPDEAFLYKGSHCWGGYRFSTREFRYVLSNGSWGPATQSPVPVPSREPHVNLPEESSLPLKIRVAMITGRWRY